MERKRPPDTETLGESLVNRVTARGTGDFLFLRALLIVPVALAWEERTEINDAS